jgi:hypothetical protein
MNQDNREIPPPPRTVFQLADMSSDIAVLTWVFCIMSVVLPLVVFFMAPQVWISVLLAMIFWLTIRFVSSFYRPKCFEICEDRLLIVWAWRMMDIPFGEITEAAAMSKSDLGLVVRTWGAGGLWGGFGRFWSRKIGHMIMYASRVDKLVCIRRRDEKPILISPDDCEKFIDVLGKYCRCGGDN